MTTESPATPPPASIPGTETPDSPPGAKPATAHTQACNHAQRRLLPLTDTKSFEDARRGFLGTIPDLSVHRPSGGAPLWNLKAYGFLAQEDAPDSVHPALWRHARLNMLNGLFQVTERVYQVRGFDLANMTIIEGTRGLIIIDPLTSNQVSRAALELYFRHRPRRKVTAVIYTHSHVDHFGGVRGVLDEAELKAGRVEVIAPYGFMQEAVSENVMAGNAMLRRSLFQFGAMLPRGPLGQVDAGLGKSVSTGTVSLLAPTVVINREVQGMRVDGVDCVFELTPGAEAPAEMIIHHPQLRVLNMAEISSHSLHNLLPLRGAQVRDGLAWSRYLGGALLRYGDQSDVLIAQHHWPVWGRAELRGFLERQRDLYRFIHDQTLRLMNHGYTAPEIAEELKLPDSLQADWASRGFYGSLKHNVKAVYQRYLGWYDANPALLDPLPPVQAARKAVEYMGGAQAALERARADYDRGEYRWVAQVASQLVHADPANQAARELCADALEQLGYQAESATWRNAYLQGAMELRQGPPRLPQATGSAPPDVVRAMPLELYFDYMAMRLNGPRAAGKTMVLNWHFKDPEDQFMLNLSNGALTHLPDTQAPQADATLILARATLDAVSMRLTTFAQAMQDGRIQVVGSTARVMEFLGLLDDFDRGFPVVEPRAPIGLTPSLTPSATSSTTLSAPLSAKD